MARLLIKQSKDHKAQQQCEEAEDDASARPTETSQPNFHAVLKPQTPSATQAQLKKVISDKQLKERERVIPKERIIDIQPPSVTFPTSGTAGGDAVPTLGKQAKTTTNIKHLTPAGVNSMSTIQQYQNQTITPTATTTQHVIPPHAQPQPHQ